MICRVIFLTVCVILAVHLSTVLGQRRRFRTEPPVTTRAPPPSSRTKVKVASARGAPSKAAAMRIARTRPKGSTGVQKSMSYVPPMCPCTQTYCQGYEYTYRYIYNTNGDVCYVTKPAGGIKETLCTQNTYNQPCYDQLACGCAQGRCKDSGLTTIHVEASCNYYAIDLYVQVYKLCCCEP